MNALMRSGNNNKSQSPGRGNSNGRGTSAGEGRLESAFARSPLQSRRPDNGANSSYQVRRELDRIDGTNRD